MGEDNEKASATTGEEGSHDEFIKNVDYRYQRVYGSVTFGSLIGWGIVALLIWFFFDELWLAILLAIGSGLLALFVMRALVHARSGKLIKEVQARCDSQAITLQSLIERAGQLSPHATFFISLVDGPLARERRRRQAQSTPSS